jgi:L-seryl-tRNA(Ser) seleniumtransferase
VDGDTNQKLRALPSVDRVVTELSSPEPPAVVAAAARNAIDEARAVIRNGDPAPSFETIMQTAEETLRERKARRLTKVINATGVLLHTNLGRAPLGEAQLRSVETIGGGYSNLEFDLTSGRRGSRYQHAVSLIKEVSGADDALVVNNNAAAVLLALAGLCAGREVIISRGELVEIGGEFRIPQVMAAAGVDLIEIGTTNRTHLVDYERAITERTAAIFKVHPSNYRVVGFASSVSAAELARLARGRGVLFLHDLGSGLLDRITEAPWAAEEPTVSASLSEGADLVTFSGDKLLGGPQAGVIAGRTDLIGILSKQPLLRALRVDKMTLAALEATLLAYSRGELTSLPLWKMALEDEAVLETRARALTAALKRALPPEVKVEVTRTEAVAGGGSSPGAEIVSWGIVIHHPERTASEIERRLRSGTPPVIARVADDRLLLDVRTVPSEDDETLLSACAEALA